MDPVAIVWFKRDLRLQDHEPLFEASKLGLPILLLFCWEKPLLNCDHLENRHFQFIRESLEDLNAQLKPFGTKILEFEGEMLEALEFIRSRYRIMGLFSHEETGLSITYARDKSVSAYCRKWGIDWKEYAQFGVQRGRANRKGWAEAWHRHMYEKPLLVALEGLQWLKIDLPERTSIDLKTDVDSKASLFQPGGSSYAYRYMRSFMQSRHRGYSKGISKPMLSRRTCSRLSPYIAWGNLSLREVFQSSMNTETSSKGALRQFETRLRWHCHFIQKFEMEDRIEFEPINRAYTLWQAEPIDHLQQAWENGMTGYPLVDACMRCVRATGYLNFRMRAMVVSFLTHLLAQPWQQGAVFLARQFLDFEPGIHYPQFQMQAGLTGINTIRIYNPVKQAEEHDPNAEFIKTWVPELAEVPLAFILQPESMPAGWQQKTGYPAPIIRLAEAHRKARETLWALQKHPDVRKESQRILLKHTLPNRMA